MKYIIALGNPGEKYRQTRHNVGFMVLDDWRSRNGIGEPSEDKIFGGQLVRASVGDETVELLYPSTYMNKVGESAVKLVPKNQVSQLVVIHDDIALQFGEIKVSVGRGDGGHNGVKSLINHLKSQEFARLRVGVASQGWFGREARHPTGGAPLERFVLNRFSFLERPQLPSVLSKASEILSYLLEHGPEMTMNRFN